MARSSRRLLTTLLGASAFPLALACNSLIGLSEYEKGDCSGGGACGDGGGPDVVAFDAPVGDVRTDVAVVDASGTKAVQWPQFRMPNYPQDGGPDANLASYSATGGGAVQDNVSKLVWAGSALSGGARSYADAEKACAGLPGGPFRVPSRIELVTLLDLTPAKAKKIDETWFKNMNAAQYWTSSEVRPQGGEREYWTVDFQSGGLSKKPASSTAEVLCIKDQ